MKVKISVVPFGHFVSRTGIFDNLELLSDILQTPVKLYMLLSTPSHKILGIILEYADNWSVDSAALVGASYRTQFLPARQKRRKN